MVSIIQRPMKVESSMTRKFAAKYITSLSADDRNAYIDSDEYRHK